MQKDLDLDLDCKKRQREREREGPGSEQAAKRRNERKDHFQSERAHVYRTT